MRHAIRRGVALSGLVLAAGSANAQHVFWGDTGSVALPSGFVNSMFLTNENVGAVDQFLAGQSVRALKIDQDVTPANIAAIYNKYKVDYTFLDYEKADALSKSSSLI